jgi:hypothetical protein
MDLILTDRLSALEQGLERAKNLSSWKEKLDLHNVRVEDSIWELAIMDIRGEVSRICAELTAIQRQVASGNSGEAEWHRYTAIYRASQELFRDSLELIGGLALREKLLDQEIDRLTDKLILNCSDSLITNTSPTIPARLELPPRMLRRVVRMRYPEWTIWTLPLAAYEFGRIAMGEIRELKNFCRRQAEAAVQVGGAVGDDRDADSKRLQRAALHVEVLMADAFATYALGPAYACPALLLQFNPVPDEPGTESGPPGTQRAELVLNLLEEMGKGGAAGDVNAFDVVLKNLRDRWDISQQPGDASQRIPLDLSDVLRIFKQELYELRPRVRYPTDRLNENIYGGWAVAQQWEEHWRNELKNHTGILTVPMVSGNSKLRDGLNAAWLCRLRTSPQLLTYVEASARQLCLAIIDERGSTKRRTGRGRANIVPRN